MKFADWLIEEQKIISIPIVRLFGWKPKVLEAINDIQEGRLSHNLGSPIVVSRLDNPRGSFYMIDGYHRAFQAIIAGQQTIEAQIDLYTPRIERTGGGFKDMVDNKVRLSDIQLDKFLAQ